MSPRDETRRRRTLAATAAAGLALALIGGIAWHVTDLRRTTGDAARRRLATGALATARMIDAWAAARTADADALAQLASIHGSDSLHLSPAIAGRILRLEMQSIAQRGGYRGVWIVDERGRTLAPSDAAPPSAVEDSGVASALRSGERTLTRPERHDSTLTIAFITPIRVREAGGVSAVEAAVVTRSDLGRAFITPGAPRMTTLAPVIVIPTGNTLLGLTLCPGPTATLCVMPAPTVLAHIAMTRPPGVMSVRVDGQPTFVATSRPLDVPWQVYVAQRQDAAFAPMRDRLRFEALALLGLLIVVGLAGYAYEKSMHLRRITERSQTEARFTAVVNTAMDAIMIVDPQFQLVTVNRAAERMFGFTSAEAPPSVLELVPPESRDEFRAVLQATLHGEGRASPFSPDRYAAGRRRDGSVFPMDLSVSRTQIGARAHLAIVIRDVTAWRRAEEHSEWQRRVLEGIATGVELRDVLGAIVRFHETQCPGVECVVHVIDDEGVTLRSASAPSMRAEFVRAFDEIVIGPKSTTCGAAVERRDLVISTDVRRDPSWDDHRALALDEGYLACWSRPILAPQGRMLGALTTYVRDPRPPTSDELRVTATAVQLAGIAIDRAYAAESLRQSEASFRSFVENSPIGIYRAASSGRLLAVNASLVRLLGYDDAADLLRADTARDLVASPADRERLERELSAHGELRSAEMEWRRKDGSTVAVRVSARAYRDERGSLWYSEGFVENVSPLRAAERALRQSEKLAALGQLVSGVAHELNNPLASILHFAEDLLEDERSEGDHEAISIIRDQARRSRAIVRDLLSFVRFRDATRERVEVRDMLLATAKALEPSLEETGARLSLSLPSADLAVHTDRIGLQQIVTNLVVNGAQAAGRGGAVSLAVSSAEAGLTIVVEDDGPGIPPALMDRIFEPFFTTKPVGAGTGLGLSVTLGIVQQLGGRIHVENRTEAEGRGARFTVVLPAARTEAELAEAATASIATPPNGVERIDATGPRALIIDDEPTIRSALRRFFLRRGWRVEEASDGAQALSALMGDGPAFDAVISDLKMPGCSGMELHDHLAAMAPELLARVIFSTGDVASREAAEFVSRTRCTVLQKPFELRALEQVVSRAREIAAV